MPIVYEQAQPNPAAIASAYGAAQTRLQAAPQIASLSLQARGQTLAAYGDAARVQAGLAAGDADRMAGERQSNAQLGLAERQFAASGTPTDRDAFAAQAAAAHEQQRFQNQAALIGVELTTQERMRLARMKNAIGDVQNDPSLSDDEKAAFTVKLRTGIDPLEHRMAKQKYELDKMVKDQMVEAKQAETALDQQRLKMRAGSYNEQIVIVPTPEAAKAASDVVKDLYPEIKPHSPVWNALVEEQVIAQGPDAYHRRAPNGKGDMEVIDESKLGDVGKGAPSGKGDNARQMSDAEMMKTYQGFAATVAKDETIPADQKVAAARKLFDEAMGAVRQHRAAAAPVKPAPFSAATPGSGTPRQRANVDPYVDVLSRVRANPNLPPAQKAEVERDVTAYLTLVGKYADENGDISRTAPPAVQARVRDLEGRVQFYKTRFAPAVAPPAPVPPTPSPVQDRNPASLAPPSPVGDPAAVSY